MGTRFVVSLTDLLKDESRWKIDDRVEVHGCACMQTSMDRVMLESGCYPSKRHCKRHSEPGKVKISSTKLFWMSHS